MRDGRVSDGSAGAGACVEERGTAAAAAVAWARARCVGRGVRASRSWPFWGGSPEGWDKIRERIGEPPLRRDTEGEERHLYVGDRHDDIPSSR